MGEDIRMGTIRHKEGKFFLDVEGKQQELPAGVVADEAQLKKLVGQKVEVLYSEPVRHVVGLVAGRRLRIMCYIPFPPFPHPICYIPAPWLIKGIEDKVRANIATQLHKEGIIGPEVYERIR